MKVLFVDDEPNVLSAIRRQLHNRTKVMTASSGREALEILDAKGPFALVVSDMRMPGMNGAELLTEIRKRSPDTVRMILSGQADLASTIDAVNEGHIFRFLTKPCPTEILWAAVQTGLEQHRLITAEKELLEQTLQGLAETLGDVLALTNPAARRSTGRIRHYAGAIADALGFAMPWDLRLATLLSQLGCITLPADIIDKLNAGAELSDTERERHARHPEVAARLIGRIPRLGGVAAMIGRQRQAADFAALPTDVMQWPTDQLSGVILAVAAGLDERMAAGDQPATALRRLETEMPGLPAAILAAARAVHMHSAYMDILFLDIDHLSPGMVLDEDIVTDHGETLLYRGEEVTSTLLAELRQRAAARTGGGKVRVLIPA